MKLFEFRWMSGTTYEAKTFYKHFASEEEARSWAKNNSNWLDTIFYKNEVDEKRWHWV